MIRDPSDGSVRPAAQARAAGVEQPMPVSEPGMLDNIKTAILAGKVKPEKIHPDYAYQRAWNDGIDFALRQIIQAERTNPEQTVRNMGETGE